MEFVRYGTSDLPHELIREASGNLFHFRQGLKTTLGLRCLSKATSGPIETAGWPFSDENGEPKQNRLSTSRPQIDCYKPLPFEGLEYRAINDWAALRGSVIRHDLDALKAAISSLRAVISSVKPLCEKDRNGPIHFITSP